MMPVYLTPAMTKLYEPARERKKLRNKLFEVAQTCALSLFCDRDFVIDSVTMKLEDDLDILNTNEAASLRHSKLRA